MLFKDSFFYKKDILLNTIQDVNGNNVREFSADDILSPVDTTLGTGLSVTVADTEAFFGNASSASIQRGIYYIKKNFVLVFLGHICIITTISAACCCISVILQKDSIVFFAKISFIFLKRVDKKRKMRGEATPM